MWLGIWDSLHAPNARWLAYRSLHILAWEFVEVLIYWVFLILWDHTSVPLIFQVDLIGERSFGGIKHGIFLCIFSFTCYNLKIQKIIQAQFFPQNSSSPIFQDPMDKYHLNLKTCPWKFHNQHQITCTQNNPFIVWDVKGLTDASIHRPRIGHLVRKSTIVNLMSTIFVILAV